MNPLTDPLILRCGLTLPGRAALAPLTNTQSHADGTLADAELRWLERRARGGFALIETCATFVSEEGQAWEGQLGAASDAHVPGLTRLAAAVKAHGPVAIVQLHHGGALATLAPERLSTGGPEGARAATPADLVRVVDDYVAAALRCQNAGFDGVEVHGANGYLFTQFLAPDDNPRTDAWGGDLTGRARLLRDTVRAVRDATRPGFAVGVRISPVDTWARRGLVLADGVELAKWLAEDGVDWVHLSLQDAAGPPPHEDLRVPVARAIRDALPPDVAVLAAGGLRTHADAARALDAGVDVTVVGKAAIVDPDWPHHPDGPPPIPWTPEALARVDVSPVFVRYLQRFPGLMVGGAPPR